MDPSGEVCSSLVKWLQTLTLKEYKSVSDISDGVAMCEALVRIAPEHFTKLESKIKPDVGSNWRLKVSNLKKVIESVIEYYQEFLNLNVMDVGKPDVIKIGETSDIVELGKLLRLILGCAVNCEKKQEYITHIIALEVSVQQSIMQAIQQLEEVTGNTGRSGGPSLDMDIHVITLIADLKAEREAKEALAQHCHELETQVQCLVEEKQALISDNRLLTVQVEKRGVPENIRSPDNRRQIDLLKEELFKMETTRDDYRAKTIEQEKQILALQEKVAELQLAADAASQLKDEVDALSESADKVQVLETTIASYKKRLEDYTDIRKQLKILEDKNVEFYQQNLKYEEELKNNGVWKSQCDIYKKQAAELQLKLDEETQRADRISFQVKNLESKYSTVVSEKERLVQERDLLVEENEELKVGKVPVKETDVARELAPTEIKERLRFLEKENNSLRVIAQEAAAKQTLLDDAMIRIDKLMEQNRTVNQRVLELESNLQESQKLHDDHIVNQLEATVREYKQKVNALQEVLAAKEGELQTCQARYTRNLEKAREVAQNLERKPTDMINLLRDTANMKEMEEQLLTVAFYRLSLLRHREAFDDRLAMLSASQGQSFLARQRQATPRKPVQSFKSK